MNKEKGISSSVGILIIIIIAIVAFGGVFAYQYFTPRTQPAVQTQQTLNTGNKSPIIEGISIEKPNLVVKGQNLSKVQIYLVPTGTGIDPETMSRIVDAVKQSENNGEQLWTYRYPSDLLVTNIFAKGFDDKGNFVKEVDLPIVGASALADALYGNVTDPTASWKTYNFTATSYLPKTFSFKYPTDWKVGLGYYSGTAMSVNITSPNGIDVISYSAGSPAGKITCDNLLNNNEVPGKLKCTTTESIPYFIVYQNDNSLNIYNQMLSTFKFTK